MIRNICKAVGELRNSSTLIFLPTSGSLAAYHRTHLRRLSQKYEPAHFTDSVYSKELFNYFKDLQNIVSVERSTWPPILLDFFGADSKVAFENFNAIVSLIRDMDTTFKSLDDIENLLNDTGLEENDKDRDDLLVIAEDEKNGLLLDIKTLNGRIVDGLIDLSVRNRDVMNEISLEISAGVGGQEAMLFAAEIFHMYQSLCFNYGQDFQIINLEETDLGGYIKASAHITFTDYKFGRMFLYESGIHRVQRVPSTDKFKRIHTSTVSVAMLPVFDDKMVEIDEKDLEITRVRKMNSPGGQHANKVESSIRIKHKPTGKIAESSASKSQLVNKELALTLLKARLSQEKMDKQEDMITKSRRRQVKNNERSDKIRTYNFHQDRIKDHRIDYSSSNVSQFMNGGAVLFELMEKLEQKYAADELAVLVKSLLDEKISFQPMK